MRSEWRHVSQTIMVPFNSNVIFTLSLYSLLELLLVLQSHDPYQHYGELRFSRSSRHDISVKGRRTSVLYPWGIECHVLKKQYVGCRMYGMFYILDSMYGMLRYRRITVNLPTRKWATEKFINLNNLSETDRTHRRLEESRRLQWCSQRVSHKRRCTGDASSLA